MTQLVRIALVSFDKSIPRAFAVLVSISLILQSIFTDKLACLVFIALFTSSCLKVSILCGKVIVDMKLTHILCIVNILCEWRRHGVRGKR